MRDQWYSESIHISFATERDVGAVDEFYRLNEHIHFAYREHLTHQYCSSASILLIRVNGWIAAAGGLFVHEDGSVELGQARVTTSAAGTYPLLVCVRLAVARARHAHAGLVFAEVDEINEKTLSTLEKLHFQRFSPPATLICLATTALPASRQPAQLGYDFVWLRATERSFESAAATLRPMAVGALSRRIFADDILENIKS
jgi:hypothetical protein